MNDSFKPVKVIKRELSQYLFFRNTTMKYGFSTDLHLAALIIKNEPLRGFAAKWQGW
jgi:hypothetical protein